MAEHRYMEQMLAAIAVGGPVRVDLSEGVTNQELARLAAAAAEFGYAYVDVRKGPERSKTLHLLLVPDPSPEAERRAAETRARHPYAALGALPPLDPDALAVVGDRIAVDRGRNLPGLRRNTRNFLLVAFGAACVAVMAWHIDDPGLAVAALAPFVSACVCLALIARAGGNPKRAATRLEAAGFTRFTAEDGRVRYVPPGVQLPGQANPYANPNANLNANPNANPYGTPSPDLLPHPPADPPPLPGRPS